MKSEDVEVVMSSSSGEKELPGDAE